MTIENATKLSELVPSAPGNENYAGEGAAHLRLIKAVAQGDAVSIADGADMLAPLTWGDPDEADDAVRDGARISAGFSAGYLVLSRAGFGEVMFNSAARVMRLRARRASEGGLASFALLVEDDAEAQTHAITAQDVDDPTTAHAPTSIMTRQMTEALMVDAVSPAVDDVTSLQETVAAQQSRIAELEAQQVLIWDRIGTLWEAAIEGA